MSVCACVYLHGLHVPHVCVFMCDWACLACLWVFAPALLLSSTARLSGSVGDLTMGSRPGSQCKYDPRLLQSRLHVSVVSFLKRPSEEQDITQISSAIGNHE